MSQRENEGKAKRTRHVWKAEEVEVFVNLIEAYKKRPIKWEEVRDNLVKRGWAVRTPKALRGKYSDLLRKLPDKVVPKTMKEKEGAQKEKEAELDTPCWTDKQEAEFATNYEEGFDCPDPDYEVWLKSKGLSRVQGQATPVLPRPMATISTSTTQSGQKRPRDEEDDIDSPPWSPETAALLRSPFCTSPPRSPPAGPSLDETEKTGGQDSPPRAQLGRVEELLLQQRTRRDNEVTRSCPDDNANEEEVQERYQYLNVQDRKRLKKMKDMVHELKQPNTRYEKNLAETEADRAENRRLAQEMADLHRSAVHQHLAFLDAALDVLRSAFSPPQ